jgi:hypothetical protein
MYTCKECNYKTDKKTDYTKHLNTTKHKNLCGFAETIDIEKKWYAKPKKEYYCNLCFFENKYKIHYDRHLDSLKHIKNQEKSDEIKEQERQRKLERLKKSQNENDNFANNCIGYVI